MIEVGDHVGRYRVESKLGEGGMGSVYRAVDEQLGRSVAIKVVRPAEDSSSDPGGLANARLLREARAAAALDHRNAVAIFDVGEHQGSPYIVMEYIDGRTLRALVAEGELSWRACLEKLIDVARALAAAHSAGLVHRDIKPDNVMVRRDGTVKVVDFGIARAVNVAEANAVTQTVAEAAVATLTAEGTQVGTVRYMAPEQIRAAPVDGRTDQFSWAVCAYEMLCGSPPWDSSNALGYAAAVTSDDPVPLEQRNPAIPREVAAVLARALSKKPEDRFATMDDVVVALEESLGTRAGRSVPPTGPAAELRRYSADEVRLVLERALEQQEQRNQGVSRQDLAEAAREIGVGEQTLQRAMSDIELARRPRPADLPTTTGFWDADRRRAANKLLRHIASYVVVNVFLYFMMHGAWQRWVLLGWGLGIALQAIKVIFPKRAEEAHAQRAPADARELTGAATPGPKRVAEVNSAAELLLQTTAQRRKLRVKESAGASTGGTAETELEEDSARRRMRG